MTIQTFSVKTNPSSIVSGGWEIKIIDDVTKNEFTPKSFKIEGAMDDFVRLSVEVPIGSLDMKNLVIDLVPIIKTVVERYDVFNEERTDGLIYHTDCLHDFVEFLEGGMK